GRAARGRGGPAFLGLPSPSPPPAVARTGRPPVAGALPRLGPLGRLAVLNVASTPQRSALTAAPLMATVALVVVVATMLQSFRVSLYDWLTSFSAEYILVASFVHLQLIRGHSTR